MRCPFLREEQVKSCQASPYRKQIARSAGQQEDERCTTAAYRSCASAPLHLEDHPDPARCPFLQESLVQFCNASAVAHYVPWSESSISPCGNDGHRFCDVFLGVAGGLRRGPALRDPAASEDHLKVASVEGIDMPGWLRYSANHLWVDAGDDGLCHVGIDAFLAEAIGSVERIAFVTVKGLVRPTVVLTVRGVDLSLSFPKRFLVAAANTRLRSTPHKLTSDPYGAGWLFQGRDEGKTDSATPPAPEAMLRSGQAARDWMRSEVRRLAEFVHEQIVPTRATGGFAFADGGPPVPSLLDHLDRDEALQLFDTFFASAPNGVQRS